MSKLLYYQTPKLLFFTVLLPTCGKDFLQINQLQVLFEKLQHPFLYFDATGMGNLPDFCFQTVISLLTLPGVVHDLKSGIHPAHGEEVVLRAVDEEHRFGTGQRGDVRIIQILTQSGKAVGESAVLPFLVGH